jgi:hypothetical protein
LQSRLALSTKVRLRAYVLTGKGAECGKGQRSEAARAQAVLFLYLLGRVT